MKPNIKSLSIFVVLPFLLFSTSFTYDDNSKYTNGDFSFIIPKKWKISKEYITADNWQYVSCSKKGIGSSGIVMMKWKKDSLDTKEILNAHRDKFKNAFGKLGSFRSDEIQTVLFNSQNALKINYSSDIISIAHSGEMYCFFLNGYTVVWISQGADEDMKVNNSGFEEIKTSFACSKN
jgi:hypothetical protein